MTQFRTTRWSLVSAAAGETRAALGELCALYWPPVYGFVRRSGCAPEDALDLTQGFFAQILEGKDLASVDRARGRFRSWLLGALRHFVANARRRERARKRGGGAAVISIDGQAAEDGYACEPVELETPELVFQRRWALTVLARVMEDLAREDGARFARLQPLLTSDEGYEAVAQELGETVGALRVQVCRLRRRYRDALRREIARTVVEPRDIDDELRHLFAALA
jgi:RNA polymerase sigma-70 factor (ECF subfamily)